MAAIGLAKLRQVPVDVEAEDKLVKMVMQGDIKDVETDWQPVFHPDAVQTKGYALLAFAGENLPANEYSDAWVYHLAAIQGKHGQWYNNLPRPPIQTGDIGATALAVHALRRYPLPGRKAELEKQIKRARHWLWNAKAQNIDGRIYQILGLAWAGEPAARLQSFTRTLLAEQKDDGCWSKLPDLNSDAYATGQAVYALRVGAGLEKLHPGVERGLRFLMTNQLDDGTWYARRRAFPFQPTNIRSGFPHGRDSWISAAATSWAVMALSLPEDGQIVALKR
jgi:N-acyl-D-amino-acid deacylase